MSDGKSDGKYKKTKYESATEQMHGIARELGELDYAWLLREINQIDCLENPDPKDKAKIEAQWSGTWEQFKFIWVQYHISRISKRLHRKFEKIAKKYPNFDKILEELS